MQVHVEVSTLNLLPPKTTDNVAKQQTKPVCLLLGALTSLIHDFVFKPLNRTDRRQKTTEDIPEI